MDFIKQKATQFAQNHFNGGIANSEELIQDIREVVASFDSVADKITFININLEKNNEVYEAHKPKCTNPANCPTNADHEHIIYYLKQDLQRLGVHFNDDTFTQEEKVSAESKLDSVLKDLNHLKAGQQVIYEEIMKELNELRELYYLGKKNWTQLLMGKSLEMVASGIISGTVSSSIIKHFSENFPVLISNT